MAGPNMKNFESIFNNLSADKLRAFYAGADDVAMKGINSGFENLLRSRARTMSGSLTDPQTLMQLARYGGRQGAVPGAGLGALLGFATAPSTETENALGAKTVKGPSIGDRLTNALTYGVGGAAIGAGTGAYNMRNLAKQLAGKNAPPEVAEAFLNSAKLGPEIEKIVANAQAIAKRNGSAPGMPTAEFRNEGDVSALLSRLHSSLGADDAQKGLLRRWFGGGDDYNTHIKRQMLASMMGVDVKALNDPAIAKQFDAAAARIFPMLNKDTSKTLKEVSEGAMNRRFAMPKDMVDDSVSTSGQIAGAAIGGGLGGAFSGGFAAMPAAAAGSWIGGRVPQLFNKLKGQAIKDKDISLYAAMKGGRPTFEGRYGPLEMNVNQNFSNKDADRLRNEFFNMKNLHDRKILQPIYPATGDPTRQMLMGQGVDYAKRLGAIGALGSTAALGGAGLAGGAYALSRNNGFGFGDDGGNDFAPLPAPGPAYGPSIHPNAAINNVRPRPFPAVQYSQDALQKKLGSAITKTAAKTRPSAAIVSAFRSLSR